MENKNSTMGLHASDWPSHLLAHLLSSEPSSFQQTYIPLPLRNLISGEGRAFDDLMLPDFFRGCPDS